MKKYETTIRITAKPEGDEVKIGIRYLTEEKTPSRYLDTISEIMVLLAKITNRTFAYMDSVKEGYYKNGYECDLQFSFEESSNGEFDISINATNPAGAFISRILREYMAGSPEAREFLLHDTDEEA